MAARTTAAAAVYTAYTALTPALPGLPSRVASRPTWRHTPRRRRRQHPHSRPPRCATMSRRPRGAVLVNARALRTYGSLRSAPPPLQCRSRSSFKSAPHIRRRQPLARVTAALSAASTCAVTRLRDCKSLHCHQTALLSRPAPARIPHHTRRRSPVYDARDPPTLRCK